MKFYQCSHCKNIVAYVQDNGPKVSCCGEEMKELVANTTDAAKEKHVPVVEVNGNLVTVSVGSVTHPMEEKHYIQWIALHTEQGNQRKELKPGQEPKVTFAVAPGDKPLAAYEYCNLHGLWKAWESVMMSFGGFASADKVCSRQSAVQLMTEHFLSSSSRMV